LGEPLVLAVMKTPDLDISTLPEHIQKDLKKDEFEKLVKLVKDHQAYAKELKSNAEVADKVYAVRNEHIRKNANNLEFLCWYTPTSRAKIPVLKDGLMKATPHAFYPWGFLGAALDHESVAVKLIYFGDLDFDELYKKHNPEEDIPSAAFFEVWKDCRRKTIDTITANGNSLTKLVRRPKEVYFWMSVKMVAEFTGRIFNHRAAFMQQRLLQGLNSRATEEDV
jgi:hypothetical protein